ncbi:uncharacterized protein LOC118733822 isoform X1 [Rhagoletis pomonella]|uniref:uncharacterized protein LOC118733822 isoform X1 n=1 Tax=Rhagoletis pomonella TaxID=28610 RepID=UPI00177DB0B2|nr:uncharacterized protein LOC118733822 isoform X1 [Rhagoletis pomonella]XP_036319296.1 uncharacterized protein LOC118733822 isoform X1 [Rhagoletis pomonella]
MPAKRSLIWSHFKNAGSKRAMCKHCSKKISFNGGSLGNLSRHMKLRHSMIRWHDSTLNGNGEGNIPEDQLEQGDQSTQSEQQLQAEQLLQMNKRMPAKRSLIWSHFENSGSKRAMCKHCSKQISFNGGSIGNLSRHMKLRHSIIRLHDATLNGNGEGYTPEEQLEPDDQSPQSEQQLQAEQLLQVNKRKPLKIDGKVASSSPPASNNPSPAIDEDMNSIYEKQIEFVDGYLTESSFINEEINNQDIFEPKSPKMANHRRSRNRKLEDLKTRIEIQLMRAKTTYFTKHAAKLDIECSLMLLQVKKLELELEKLRNEAQENPLASEQMGFESVRNVEL